MPFPQLLSFDIDTTLPRGWGGMSRFVRSSSPAKRVPPHPLCKSPLYFQQLTNCFFAKSFSLIRIQTAPGGGGVVSTSLEFPPQTAPSQRYQQSSPSLALFTLLALRNEGSVGGRHEGTVGLQTLEDFPRKLRVFGPKSAFYSPPTPTFAAPVVVPPYFQSFNQFCTRSPIVAWPPPGYTRTSIRRIHP